MELYISKQLVSLLSAFPAGLGLGLLYDVLRVFRERSRRAVCVLLDLLFCLCAFVTAFVQGISVCGGSLGIWETAALALGFYIGIGSFSKLRLIIKRAAKKTSNFLKFFFSKVQ